METAPTTDPLEGERITACVGGNSALLLELVDVFLEDCPKLVTRVEQGLQRGDAEQLRYAAHTLRGLIGHFATGPAYRLAAEMESLACAQDLTAAARTLPELLLALGQLQPALIRLTTNQTIRVD